MRISVRLDDDTQKMIEKLIDLYQKDSISKVTTADVIRKAIETLHKESTATK